MRNFTSRIIRTFGILLLLFFTLHGSLQAQDTLRVMVYNLLNFQFGGGGIPNRQDTLAKILQYVEPDVFMVCELSNAAASAQILNESLNIYGKSNYSAATYLTNFSTSNNTLHNMLYYNHDKLTLYSQDTILTDLRDINRYTLYCNGSGQDTIFVDFYVTHLKAGNTSSDRNRRNTEVTKLRNYLNTQPTLRNNVFAGDFNVYNSSEAAYQTITTTGTYPFIDPINQPGTWSNNSSFASIHTQCTRLNQLGGDGSSSGMDDRFDQILVSSSVMSGTGRVRYLPGSYRAVGQDGLHYNVSVNDLPHNTSEPDSVINALYYMSDHLPVYMELEIQCASPLPFAGLAPTAKQADEEVQLNCKVYAASEGSMLKVERMDEFHDFREIGRQAVSANSEVNLNDFPEMEGGIIYKFSLINAAGRTVKTEYAELQFSLDHKFHFVAFSSNPGLSLDFGKGSFRKGLVRIQDMWGRVIFEHFFNLENPVQRLALDFIPQPSQMHLISVFEYEQGVSGTVRYLDLHGPN
ncbi:MAG: hypothetical protein H6581_00320 [Bacteroidia bacterium]|nr:hypothetical protein [Bacteroidia bacterium]